LKLHHKKLGPAPQPGGRPTLVLLHGYGADELDLVPLAVELDPSMPVVSLQGPLSLGGGMRAWYQLQQTPQGFLIDESEVRASDALLAESLAELAGERGKLVLSGFSQGGGMAARATLFHPEHVRGVACLSSVPPRTRPEQRAPPDALKGLPAFVAHGEHDPLLGAGAGREVRDELQNAGLQVTYREYPMGHMIVGEEVADLRSWLTLTR